MSEPLACQGTLLVDWSVAGKPGGGPREALPSGGRSEAEPPQTIRGTNVFELSPEGRIVRVVGFWRT